MSETDSSFFGADGDAKKRVLFFVGSITPAITAVVVLYMLGPAFYQPAAAVFSTYYFTFGAGWITSPLLGLSAGMHPGFVAVLLVFIAVESSLIVSVNYELLENIPLAGRLINRIREKATRLIEQRELGRSVSYATIFWLMFIPIYGTGPMTLSIAGRLLGLDWKPLWLTISLSVCTRYTLIVVLLTLGLWSL